MEDQHSARPPAFYSVTYFKLDSLCFATTCITCYLVQLPKTPMLHTHIVHEQENCLSEMQNHSWAPEGFLNQSHLCYIEMSNLTSNLLWIATDSLTQKNGISSAHSKVILLMCQSKLDNLMSYNFINHLLNGLPSIASILHLCLWNSFKTKYVCIEGLQQLRLHTALTTVLQSLPCCSLATFWSALLS